MGISTQHFQNVRDFNSNPNLDFQNVQNFNSNPKPSKIPDYAKDYKNEYLFIIGIDGCFKYFVDNFENIFEDYLSFNKKFESIKKIYTKIRIRSGVL